MQFTESELNDLNGITSTRHGFIMPFSVLAFIARMDVESAGMSFMAIHHYVTTGVPFAYAKSDTGQVLPLPDNSLPKIAIQMFIDIYEKDAGKYLTKVKQNRDAGEKGGKAPRKNGESNT